MKIRTRWLLCISLLVFFRPVFSQELLIEDAQLSVPFGSIEGKLMAVGDFLIFVDREQNSGSFAVRRDNIRDLSVDSGAGQVTLETWSPVTDRSGQRSRLEFRVRNADRVAGLHGWLRESPSEQRTGEVGGTGAVELTYQAEHNHRFGSCEGRLILTDATIAYESVESINHSRHWALKDIKEIKLNNPYELEISPFSGSNYKIRLQGQGMTTTEFRRIVEGVTSARVRR